MGDAYGTFSRLLEDMEFPAFAGAFVPQDADRLSWIREHWTSDRDTILRRSAVLEALHPDAEAAADLDTCAEASAMMLDAGHYLGDHKKERIRAAFAGRVIAREYIRACDAMGKLLARHPEAALDELRSLLDAQTETLTRVRGIAQELDGAGCELPHVDFGVNITQAGEALVILPLLDGEQAAQADADAEGTQIMQEIRFARDNNAQFFEVFIRRILQLELAGQWKKLEKILVSLPVENILSWARELSSLELIRGGLRLAKTFADRGCPVCRPEIGEDVFAAEELYYPHLAIAAMKPVSPYTFWFDSREPVLITGANHAGKTSFLKTFAQSCVLAQLGFLVPAKSFTFVPASAAFSLFSGGEDAAADGERSSRFRMDARFLRELLAETDRAAAVGQYVTTFFNEPFTGTNPVEGVELLRDLMHRLYRTGTFAMVVTHLYDVYEMLEIPVVSYVARYDEENDRRYLEKRAPDGAGMTQKIAEEFGVTVPQLLGGHEASAQVLAFLEGRKA